MMVAMAPCVECSWRWLWRPSESDQLYFTFVLAFQQFGLRIQYGHQIIRSPDHHVILKLSTWLHHQTFSIRLPCTAFDCKQHGQIFTRLPLHEETEVIHAISLHKSLPMPPNRPPIKACKYVWPNSLSMPLGDHPHTCPYIVNGPLKWALLFKDMHVNVGPVSIQ
jgi:hypothetical protein